MMFKLEKEMMPVLKKDIRKLFGDVHTTEEFVSGIGRPDLVFARIADTLERDCGLPSYQVIEMMVRYMNVKKSVIHIDRIVGLAISKKKMISIFESLTELGFIEKRDDGSFVIKNTYKPLVDNFVSVEMKLSNWKDGFYQAIRYKTFSDSAYLAISEEYVKNVDQKLLRESGIGLISVSPSEAKLIFKAKRDNPRNMISHHYLTETFCISKGLVSSSLT